MPDPLPPDPLKVPDLKGQAEQMLAGASESPYFEKVVKRFEYGVTNGVTDIVAWVLRRAANIGVIVGRVLAGAENKAAPEFAELASTAVQDLFGVPASPGAMNPAGGRGGRTQVAVDVGDMLFKAFAGAAGAGTGGAIVPSDAPAKAFLSTMTQLSLEGWLEGWVAELLSLGQMETFGELDDKISHTLGLGRASASVHGPLVKDLIVTPLQWKLNITHRPTPLSNALNARLIASGRGDPAQWREDLRREGFSEERIAEMVIDQGRFHSVADLDLLIRSGQWNKGSALAHLQDAGYPPIVAETELLIEQLKGIESFERAMITSAVTAYADGRIDEAQLGGFITGTIVTQQERAQFVELAHARRALSLRGLTPGEAEQCVKAKILSLSDYRAALRRDGRTEDAITALDLLLRWEMDKATAIETHRRQQEEERAREKAARDEAARLRAAQLAADRALRRRGSESVLEAAAIRGLVPLARVEEIYRAKYDGETVGAYMELLAAQRQDYIDRTAAAALAKERGAQRGVDVGSLERAVTVGTLTLGEYRRRLQEMGFSGADAGLLAATLEAHLEDVAEAQRDRDEAAAAAKVRRIDLGRLETLVRRGHRSLGEYSNLLGALGFDEPSRAAMVELLQLRINDDAADRAEREAAEARLRVKGISLEQLRRGVLLGVATVDDFSRFLVANGFTADAQVLLLASLRADVAEAEAARQRRLDAEAESDTRRAPLSDVARAARLGIVTVATYTARLVADGYTPDDVALETDLLVEEIAAVQAARRAREAAAADATNRGLSLAQLARLVHNGRSTITQYRDAARAAGYSPEAADALAGLLEDERAAETDAKARRAAVTAAAAVRQVSLPQLEAGVLAGLRKLDDYAMAVRALGYGDDDAELLVGLLAGRLEAQLTAEQRRAELAAENAVRELGRADVAKGVIAGLRSIEDYAVWLTGQGYAADDVELLVDLVLVELQKATKGPGGV